MYEKRLRRILLPIAILTVTAPVSPAGRQDVFPVYVANQNPFVQIFGLPKAEPGTITPKGKLDAGFLYFVSNNAISNTTSRGDTMIWDGETAQYTIRLRYGMSERQEVGLDLPFIQHSGGYLDSLIRNYHNMFGFPNNRQEQFDKNQIQYHVADNGTDIYSMNKHQAGLGDLRISVAVPLLQNTSTSKRHLAIRSLLKLPTGEAADLLGSGGTDVSIGLAYSDYQTLRNLNTVLTAYGGITYLGDAEVMESMQRNLAGYGGISAGWMALERLDLKLQLDMHSAFYDSELVQLGSSVQLLAGGTAHLPGRIMLDLGISEQLVTDATPDVGFYLFARRLF